MSKRNKVSTVTIITGQAASGKTTKLLEKAKKAAQKGKHVIVLLDDIHHRNNIIVADNLMGLSLDTMRIIELHNAHKEASLSDKIECALVSYKADCLFVDVLGLSATDLPTLSYLADKLEAKVFATMQAPRRATVAEYKLTPNA